ncbi:uncharacterized protein LOC143875763 isoform X2 [Tasmannia lanceolata]|uniref:uncharacterized protein LOC143875763 isoform X2 n=1 Tax=Tasmannia lanceolata TaxID=3420 RepID=UPI00406384DF
MEDFAMDLKQESQTYDEDEFYEKIEAPKFVDLTVADRFRPDDSSWFCLRVGCDQKHDEEDMDPDTLYKKFVLRVMAARSPNVRLRKTLSRQASSATVKCPLSAPSKSSKDKIQRLNLITSISQKVGDAKVRVPHFSKFRSTPNNGKAKQPSAAVKALTTPKHKMARPNPEPFRSVRSSKVTVTMPKNRTVAKALVFHSPKKIEKANSLKCNNPEPVICREMKKVQKIRSQKKCVSGHSVPTPNNAKSRLHARKLNSNQAELSSVPRDGMSQKPSSTNCEKISYGNLEKYDSSAPKEEADNDASDMDIDGKSRNGSLEASSPSAGSRTNEGNELEENHRDATEDESLPSSVESLNRENSLSNSELNDLEDKYHTIESKIEENADKGNGTVNTSVGVTSNTTTEEESDPSSEESTIKENSLPNSEKDLKGKDPTLQTLNGVAYEMETMESADKENISASDNNRDMNLNPHHSTKETPQHGGGDTRRKVITMLGKNIQECPAAATAGSRGGKYKKAKPTNPKPFRLRTDERGILREANLERRMQLLNPFKEITPTSRFPNEIIHKRHINEKQQNGKAHGQYGQDSNAHGGSQIELQKTVQKAQLQRRPIYRKLTKCSQPKMVMTTSEREKLEGKEKVNQKMRNNTALKSPSLGDVRSQRFALCKVAGSPSQLGVIKETSSASRPKEAPWEAMRTPSHGKRLAMAMRTPERQKLEGKEKATQKMRNNTALKSQSSSLGYVRSQRFALCKETDSASQLSLIKEHSSNSRPKETHCEAQAVNSTTGAPRSSSRGKRPATVPKEPNFHRINVPNDCTKKLVNVS